MDSTSRVRGVSAVSPQLYVTSLRAPSLSGSEIAVYGIDPETDFTIRPWLGRAADTRLRPGEVILGYGVTGDISSEITLFNHAYTVAGRLDRTQSLADQGIFMAMDDAYALAWTDGVIPEPAPRVNRGDISAVLVRIDPGQDKDAVSAQIWRAFPHDQVAVIGRSFSLDPASREVRELPGILNTIAARIVVAAFPLIAVISAMVARERQREIGLLRTMGAKRRTIVALVIAESLTLAAIGGLAGVFASLVACFVLHFTGFLNSILLIQVRLPPLPATGPMAFTAVLAVVTIGGLSALYPAVRSSLMNPYDAIRNDGR
jgi:putative ABC transport system permease protein